MLSDSELIEIKAISKEHPVVGRLLEAYLVYHESPYAESYITCRDMIDYWRDELRDRRSEFTIIDTEDKKFDRALNVVKALGDLVANLDDLRRKMTPEQRVEADKRKRIKDGEDKIVLS